MNRPIKMSVCIPNALCRVIAGGLLLTLLCSSLRAESDGTLAGRVIDFKNSQPISPGGLAIGKRVEASAQADILADTTLHRSRQAVFSIAATGENMRA